MRLKPVIALSVILLFGAAAAHAVPITYTVAATGTGSLGASSFTNALVTITLTADTSTVTHPFGVTFNNSGPATVDVAGIGTATLTDNFIVFDNQAGGPGGIGAAGIEDNTIFLNLLDTANAAFASYDLKSAIGPITGTALFNAGNLFPTNRGDFTLTSVGDSTFTATINGQGGAQAAPTLSEWAMIGLGLLLAAVGVWQLRRHSPAQV